MTVVFKHLSAVDSILRRGASTCVPAAGRAAALSGLTAGKPRTRVSAHSLTSCRKVGAHLTLLNPAGQRAARPSPSCITWHTSGRNKRRGEAGKSAPSAKSESAIGMHPEGCGTSQGCGRAGVVPGLVD